MRLVGRDVERSAVYDCEHRVERLRAKGGPVEMFGSTWDVEAEIRFETIESMQAVADRVTDLYGVRRVTVVARGGFRQATYRSGTIAIPTRASSDGWALTLFVLLHELAHHLAGGNHDPGFRAVQLDLLRKLDQPISATLLGMCYAERGLRITDRVPHTVTA